VKVVWTDIAVTQLQVIYDFISQTSEDYALRVVDRLTRRSQQIAAFPLSGRTIPEYEADEIREIIEGAYRIIYFVAAEQVEVLAVIHGAQKIPPRA